MGDVLQKERVKLGNYLVDIRKASAAEGKPSILLIHGIGVAGDYFLPFAELLAPDYDVRIIDMPGYGKTPRPDHALPPVELADVAAQYLMISGLKSVTVIGQSMGCQTAVHLASRYTELCKNVILIGPTVNRQERSLFMQALRLFQDSIREPTSVNKIILRDYFRMGIERFLRTAVYMVSDHVEEPLKDISVPVLLVRGSKDVIVPRQWTKYLEGLNKRISAAEIEGGPHNIQYTHPKELLAVCNDFLKR